MLQGKNSDKMGNGYVGRKRDAERKRSGQNLSEATEKVLTKTKGEGNPYGKKEASQKAKVKNTGREVEKGAREHSRRQQ